MYHWDTLTLTHFPMDTERLVPSQRTLQFKAQDSKSIKILHCPNHVNIKGTKHFKKP